MKKLHILLLLLLLSGMLFLSCDKEEKAPDKVIVERITVVEFPGLKDGEFWDPDEAYGETDPDFTFNIYKNGNEVYSLENVIFNADQSVVVFDNNGNFDPIIFSDVELTYNFKLWDYDEISKEIVASIDFKPYQEGYPDNIYIENSETKIEMKLSYEK